MRKNAKILIASNKISKRTPSANSGLAPLLGLGILGKNSVFSNLGFVPVNFCAIFTQRQAKPRNVSCQLRKKKRWRKNNIWKSKVQKIFGHKIVENSKKNVKNRILKKRKLEKLSKIKTQILKTNLEKWNLENLQK